MSVYLQPEDDGLPMRSAGPWAKAKLDYLARYIDVFETAMREKWAVRHYVDLFAGPGKNRVRDSREILLGSPLLALTTRYPFTGYFFVDLLPENANALQRRCSASPERHRVTIFTGDCNAIIDEIVAQIRQTDQKRQRAGLWTSLNLAFLDPKGLELQWATVAKLASVSRMDLIITYPQGGLNRYMRQAFESNTWTAVDHFFGGREWRDIYAQYRRRQLRGIHRHLIDFYREKLQTLGYQQVIEDTETGYEPLIRNAQTRAPMYRLVFASKHPLGHDFWEKITRRDVAGQLRMF